MALSFLGRPVGFVSYRKSYCWCILSRSHVTCSGKDQKLERIEWCALTTPSGVCQEPAHQRWEELSCFRSWFFCGMWICLLRQIHRCFASSWILSFPTTPCSPWNIQQASYKNTLLRFSGGSRDRERYEQAQHLSCQFIAHVLPGVYFNPYISDRTCHKSEISHTQDIISNLTSDDNIDLLDKYHRDTVGWHFFLLIAAAKKQSACNSKT